MDDQPARSTERTAEEVAWDKEFEDTGTSDIAKNLRDMAAFAARLPAALIKVPMEMMPDETARHTRAAAREGFLAVRSLFSAIGDRIEVALSEPGTTPTDTPTVKGPEGTWGTGRAARTTRSKTATRIDVDS